MAKLTPFDAEAVAMFHAAKVGVRPDFTYDTRDVMLLGDGLEDIANETERDADDETSAVDAARVLLNRIGGYSNLRSYVDCLRAGYERRKVESARDTHAS